MHNIKSFPQITPILVANSLKFNRCENRNSTKSQFYSSRPRMSSLEPPTTANITIETTKGSIEVEIWAKEIPITTKSFLQNCLDGKYTGQTFPTILPNLVQLEPIDGADYQFKDEFHSRIRFNRKGLLGFLKENEDFKNNHTTGSFFVTLTDIPQYNNKYIIFGKVVGDSFYNVMKIRDSELKDGIPIYPAKITNIKVNIQYFEDLVEPVPQEIQEPVFKKAKKGKGKVKLNYDDGEEVADNFVMKSAHELLNDRKLSNKLYVEKANKVIESEVELRLETDSVERRIIEHTDSDISPEKVTSDNSSSLEEVNTVVPSAEKPTTQSVSIAIPSTRKSPVARDPTLDSDYDPNLDLSDDEFDPVKLHNHKFIVS